MKICVRCKTENNQDYKYCKTCGAELPFVDKKPIWEYDGESQNTAEENFQDSREISTYEMNVFVGKNSNVIVPKFVQLGREDKKVSFCLPVLLLGLFLGSIGVAAYFLYRKMIKPAVIIMAAAFVVALASFMINFATIREAVTDYRGLLSEAINMNGAMSDAEFEKRATEIVTEAEENSIAVFDYISNYVLGVGLSIVMALFADYIYKEHAITKISQIKAEGLPKTEYFLTLHRRGGTSGGAVALGIGIFIAAVFVTVLVPVVIALFV